MKFKSVSQRQDSEQKILVLHRLSELIAQERNVPVIYRGPVPYQGLARFDHRSLLNRMLRSLSLRWLLLRELLSDVWHKVSPND